jgi:hypothetical protein
MRAPVVKQVMARPSINDALQEIVACEHDGYREIVTRYDRVGGLLTYHWRCEACGLVLHEASRLPYRPRFAPLPEASYLMPSPANAGPRRRADAGAQGQRAWEDRLPMPAAP